LYEDVLRRNQDILADPFIAENIDEVTRNMRTKGLLKLIAPYKRMRLDWIAKQLQLPAHETRDIVGFLITDGRIHGGIDEREGTLVMSSESDLARTQAILDMTKVVDKMFTALMRDGHGFKSSDTSFVADPGAVVEPLAAFGRNTRRKGKMPQSSMRM
jgi:COP9 signalosome complex subunit 2